MSNLVYVLAERPHDGWSSVLARAPAQSPARECLAAFVANDGAPAGPYSSWCSVRHAVDVAAVANALASLGVDATLIAQPPDSTAWIIPTNEPLRHFDLELALAWSPAVLPATPPPATSARDGNARPAPSVPAPSPHRAEVDALLANAQPVALKDQPPFRHAAALSAADRRALLLDLRASPPSGSTALLADMLGILMLEYTDVCGDARGLVELFAHEARMPANALLAQAERFAANQPALDGDVATALLASTQLAALARHAPKRLDKYSKKEPPARAAALRDRARGAPPFPSDPWGASIRADLDRMSARGRDAWQEAFSAWDAHPAPIALDAGDGAGNADARWRARAGDVVERAVAWLDAFAASEDPAERSSEWSRNVGLADGLAALVLASPPQPALTEVDRTKLARSLARRALERREGGGISSPRLAGRALAYLHRVHDEPALRAIAASEDVPPRLRRYATGKVF